MKGYAYKIKESKLTVLVFEKVLYRQLLLPVSSLLQHNVSLFTHIDVSSGIASSYWLMYCSASSFVLNPSECGVRFFLPFSFSFSPVSSPCVTISTILLSVNSLTLLSPIHSVIFFIHIVKALFFCNERSLSFSSSTSVSHIGPHRCPPLQPYKISQDFAIAMLGFFFSNSVKFIFNHCIIVKQIVILLLFER